MYPSLSGNSIHQHFVVLSKWPTITVPGGNHPDPQGRQVRQPLSNQQLRPIALLSPNCNPTLQKGFLSSINGVVEQTFAICSIVCYSAQSSPFHIVSRPKQCLWLKTPSSLNPNHRLGTASKLGYLLANCHFSSRPVQIAYQPPLTSYAGTIECNKCPLCNSPTPTSAHILNGCQEALIQS